MGRPAAGRGASSTATDPAIAALEAGVHRALRSNRPLLLCRLTGARQGGGGAGGPDPTVSWCVCVCARARASRRVARACFCMCVWL